MAAASPRRDVDEPTSPKDLLDKARRLLEQGGTTIKTVDAIEDELQVRLKASTGCENVFHALVVLTDVIIGRAVKTHDERVEALQDMGRHDLARLYGDMKDALHTSCYYNQRFGARQRRAVEELSGVVEREIEKLK